MALLQRTYRKSSRDGDIRLLPFHKKLYHAEFRGVISQFLMVRSRKSYLPNNFSSELKHLPTTIMHISNKIVP